MKDFRELLVWQRGRVLALSLYRTAKTFPQEEVYRLTAQTRRAAAPTPANIAEGCGRDSEAGLEYLPARENEILAVEILELRRMPGASVQRLEA